MAFDTSKFIESFLSVGKERLLKLEKAALEGESLSKEDFEGLMREAHTLKGEARMVGFKEISDMAHQLEDFFLDLKQGTGDKAEIIDKILNHIQEIRKKFNAIENKKQGKPKKQKGKQTRNIRVKESKDKILRVRSERFKKITDLSIETACAFKQIEQTAIFFRKLCSKLSEIRIEWDQAYLQLSKEASNVYSQVEGLNENFHQFCDLLTNLRCKYENAISLTTPAISSLLVECLAARMRPLSRIFDAYPAEVRRIASRLGKKVNIYISGGNIELDRDIVEAINEPLIHLVRNAIDHGIESPSQREMKGKSPIGNLWIRAKRQGQKVIIEVEDDGKGIDIEKIRNKSLKKGIILDELIIEQDGRLSESLKKVLFSSGFSTKDEVSDISGRGVGMDTVKKAIYKLNGLIDIFSYKDKGTKVILELPISLALMQVLIIRVDQRIFSLPTHWVKDIVFFDSSKVLTHEGLPKILIRDESYYLFDLAKVLNLKSSKEKTFVVILGHDRHKKAFLIDELITQTEVILKPIPSYLRTELVVGANIFEDGKISLVLNVSNILRVDNIDINNHITNNKQKKYTKPRILIVDDAVITRSLLKNILTSAGYDVSSATNGMEALELLGQEHFDIVLTDLEMPIMDGYELTKEIRSNDRLKTIPIIILSSHETQDEIKKGFSVGADEYLQKGKFSQQTLIKVIEELLHHGNSNYVV